MNIQLPQKKTRYSKSYLDKEKINTLCDIVAENIESYLDTFGVDYSRSKSSIKGCCPVHGGDRFGAFTLYPDGQFVRGFWKCRSHNCHIKYKSTLVGLTRGMLEYHSGCKVSYFQAVDWMCNFLGQDIDNLKPDLEMAERRKEAYYIQNLTKKQEIKNCGITRNIVRSMLDIPASYYVDRKYSKDVLDKYDVGLCTKPNKEMSGRVVVPVYDNYGKYIIGCTGRSVYEQCPKCKCYHNPKVGCPTSDYERFLQSKWRHSKSFTPTQTLYNYWFAKKYIKSTGCAVIVEGPGDVWRLEEGGVRNSVATFGANMHDVQQILLEKAGAMNLVIINDNDAAGEKFKNIISETLRPMYNLHYIQHESKDIGDTSADFVRNKVLPIVDSLRVWK